MKPEDVRGITQSVDDPLMISRLMVVMLLIELVAISIEIRGGFVVGGMIPVIGGFVPVAVSGCPERLNSQGVVDNVPRETIGDDNEWLQGR